MREIAAAEGAVRPDQLARALGVERSAVEGMIGELVRLGRLRAGPEGMCAAGRGRGPCGRTCDPAGGCPLIARMPAALEPVPRR